MRSEPITETARATGPVGDRLVRMNLVCPHCERPLEGHEDKACRRRMSRRWFLGALGGVVAAVVLPKRVPTGGLFDPKADVAGQWARSRLGELSIDDFAARYIEPAAKRIAMEIDRAFLESVTVTEHWHKRADGIYRSVEGGPFEKTPFVHLPFVKFPAAVHEPW